MPFPLIAAVAASLISGAMGAKSAKNAANAQQQSDAAAIAEQRRQFDLTRQDYAPYLATGRNALADIYREFGYDTTGLYGPEAATQPQPGAQEASWSDWANGWMPGANYQPRGAISATPSMPTATATPTAAAPASYAGTGFTASPDYAFRRSEGLRDIGNLFSARGGAQSGNALRALNQYNSDLASSEYGNWFNRRAGLAGVGQTATNSVSATGANTAGNIGALLSNSGSARASGILGQGAAWSNTANDIITNILYGRGGGKKNSLPY